MALTNKTGLVGQSRKGYAYCAGVRETDRRAAQIRNGTLRVTPTSKVPRNQRKVR